ncbi:Mpo1 family 2-hydroxy fatty acid dioxygenase [Algicola sagamiensis]|uniref:Mpo1 family 2-hydroxy fatty acid dioxygenase n=1 Tax=Algicola sagamiensis TaxID=163869 RepID=UPI000368276A|nr:Mpo1-like protein [Algicola sagamiensis]
MMQMKTLDEWFEEYAQSHQNPTNKKIHFVAVPIIYATVIGIFWSLPTPWNASLNWSILMTLPVLVFYFFLSPRVALGMGCLSMLIILFCFWLEQFLGVNILWLSVITFVIAWIFQFIGHHIEGKKPSFLKDIFFLLIGPAWVLCYAYRRWGIRY